MSRPASSPTTISSAPAACSELRRDADRLAGDEALARVGRRRDDLAGLDADPDGEPDTVLVRELIVQCGDPGPGVEGGTGGAQRVVLV